MNTRLAEVACRVLAAALLVVSVGLAVIVGSAGPLVVGGTFLAALLAYAAADFFAGARRHAGAMFVAAVGASSSRTANGWPAVTWPGIIVLLCGGLYGLALDFGADLRARFGARFDG